MKTTNLIFIALMCLLVCSCTQDVMKSMNNAKCMETVAAKYPTARVIPLPDNNYKFLVIEKDGGPVHYVTVPGRFDQIGADIVLGR